MEEETDGDSYLCVMEDAASLGFGGGRDHMPESLAFDQDSAVESGMARNGGIGRELKITSYATSSLGSDKIRCVTVNGEDHVTSVETDVGVGVSVDVVHEPLRFVHRLLSRLRLFRGNLIKSRKNGVVECPTIVEEAASDGLDELGVLRIE